MIAYTEKIREIAGKLLKDGTVDVFIGYKKGSVPLMNEPVLIRDADHVDKLYWESRSKGDSGFHGKRRVFYGAGKRF